MKIIQKFTIAAFCLSSVSAVFGQRSMTVTTDANSAALFRLSGNHPVVEFVEVDPAAVIEITGVVNGSPIRRFVDNDATLASGNYYIEFFTMAKLNNGELPLQVYSSPVELTLTALEDKPNLFPDDDLFNISSEEERVLAVDRIAETYLADSAAQQIAKEAARVPLSYLKGEGFEKNADGTSPYFHELMSITAGHPQSYKLKPRLKVIAKQVAEDTSSKELEIEASVELQKGAQKLPITIMGKNQTRDLGIPYAKLRDLVQDIVAPRLFNTGNAYPDPNMDIYRSFRLPGDTRKAISLNDLAKAVVRKLKVNGVKAEDVSIEVIAYNGYTWNFRFIDPEVFLIVPKVQVEDPLFLACTNNVDAEGAPLKDIPLGVFGVKSINLIYIK
ncbi:MAG: hypothetical protein AAF065_10990 [Verrucomicrobiota bacterium]